MSRPSITRLPSPAIARCCADQDGADRGEPRDQRRGAIDHRRADGGGHVDAVDGHARRVDVDAGAHRPARRRRLRRRAATPRSTRRPGHRAIHRAGVDVPIAERLRHLARHRALARARRAVNRDHHDPILPLWLAAPHVAAQAPAQRPRAALTRLHATAQETPSSCSSSSPCSRSAPGRPCRTCARRRWWSAWPACTASGSTGSPASQNGPRHDARHHHPGARRRDAGPHLRAGDAAGAHRAAHRRRPCQGHRRAAADEAGAAISPSAGTPVVTAEIDDLLHYRITPQLTDALEDAILWVAADRGLRADGRLGVFGVSFAGGLSIVAAGRPQAAPHVAYVVSFGGHGNLPRRGALPLHRRAAGRHASQAARLRRRRRR